jgi:cysteine desulfurase
MHDAATASWANPASTHSAGREARALVETAREAVAELCRAEPRGVIFTSGATEANNLALRSATVLVTSRLEHPSIVRVAESLEEAGVRVVWLPVPSSGRLDLEDLRQALRGLPPGFVVAMMAANHETGVLQPVSEAARLVHELGGKLHVDAAQAAGKLQPDDWAVGDTVSLAGHKLRGPKGVGALVLRSPGLPRPVLLGGAQERGIRPGTVDPVAAAGLAVAARRSLGGGPDRETAIGPWRDRLEAATRSFATPNGDGAPRLPHVSNLSFDGWRGDELVAALDLEGVCASSGSACSAGTAEPSPVITAMRGRERATSAIRFSLGEDTTEDDVLRTIDVLNRIVRRQAS